MLTTYTAAPPQPPKHLTDQELKEQYGIHMTSRILGDDEGKEAKWADIDDEEDDWAPETIEWNDGTKVTLAKPEPVPPPAPEPQEPAPAPVLNPEPIKPKILASKPAVGPNATVLRVGANADKQGNKTGGLVLKGTSEKPGESVKSPSPAPTKSPWAPLPPVDKVSPVVINPPQSQFPPPPQPPPRFPQRDLQGFESMPPMASPAKEIAADDFNRIWHDNQAAAPRELFNSHSGRYEPVKEGRRGSRNDPGFRAPSLLQRPSQDQMPAEPSAAFQSHRSSANHEGSQWNRRRASSNLSSGSGSYGRRMSLSKASEMPSMAEADQQRRGSRQGPPTDLAVSPTHQARPTYLGPQAPGPGQNQHVTGPNQAQPSAGEPAGQQETKEPVENPVALQQRLMREKREEAIRRRKEQEEREEAEKRERIRIKMESLGMPPPGEKVERVEREKPTEKVHEDTQPAPAPVSPMPQDASLAPSSPPKPPIPEASGEPKQYGMMKVHHPENVKKFMTPSTETTQDRRLSSPTKRRESEATNTSPVRRQPSRQSDQQQSQPPLPRDTPAQEPSAQPWKGTSTGPDAYTSWANPRVGQHAPASGNLWGPPSNDKALGNGTFDRNLASFAARPMPFNRLSSNEQRTMAQPPTGPGNGFGMKPLAVDQPMQASMSAPERTSLPDQGKNDTSKARALAPGPIAPPSAPAAVRNVAQSAWNNFAQNTARDEALLNQRLKREHEARMEEDRRNGIKPEIEAPVYEQTWRQVNLDKQGGRQVIGVEKSDTAPQPKPTLPSFGAIGTFQPLSDPLPKVTPPTAVAGRGSRFFPQPEPPAKSSLVDMSHSSSPPSPPPPEEIASHPAFTGDVRHPFVHLPAPKPVVKLPPAVAPSPRAPPTFAAAVASPAPSQMQPMRAIGQPIVNSASWQERFNGLLGRPEKKHALAVNSASKEPLDVLPLHAPIYGVTTAAVSLPQRDDFRLKQLLQDAGKIFSKDPEQEEELFEDREPGSLPTVRIPNVAPTAAWQPAPPPPTNTRPRSKFTKSTEITSIEPYLISLFDQENQSPEGFKIFVNLPGHDGFKVKIFPREKMGQMKPTNQSRPPKPSRYSNNNNPKSTKPRGNANKAHNAPSGQSPRSNSLNPMHNAQTHNAMSPKPPFNNIGSANWARRASGMAH